MSKVLLIPLQFYAKCVALKLRRRSKKTTLTFDWRRGKVSEEADCHFQDVGFLQFGVSCVAFSNQRQNQTFQVSEAVVDASSSSLLQQRLESLTQVGEFGYSAALFTESRKQNLHKQSSVGLLTFLSSLACFLWATVELAGRGCAASVMALGLISFVFVACSCAFLDGGLWRLERLGSTVPKEARSLLFM